MYFSNNPPNIRCVFQVVIWMMGPVGLSKLLTPQQMSVTLGQWGSWGQKQRVQSFRMSSRCQRHSRLPLTCCPHYAHSYWQGKWKDDESSQHYTGTGETQDWVRFRVFDEPLANEQQIASQYSCHVICSTKSEKSVASSHTRDVRLGPGTRRGRRPTCIDSTRLALLDFWHPTILTHPFSLEH